MCHLQVKKVLPLPFRSLGIFFLAFFSMSVTYNIEQCEQASLPVPSFRRVIFRLAQGSMMSSVDFLQTPFIRWRNAASIPTFLRVFTMNGCWISSNAPYASIDIITWFSFFRLLMWWVTLINVWTSFNFFSFSFFFKLRLW